MIKHLLAFKEKKAFTLIELLAIIVILAIIAVITVPIILNIIENARMGTAKDSAYGYKDAVNKYFVSELFDNKNLKLDGDYIIENGKLKGANLSDLGVVIPADGTIPTSGKLTYENSVFKSGCLVMGDYAVTFNSDGSVSALKGECSLGAPTIASCPGCKFFYTNYNYIGGNIPEDVVDDYTVLTSGGRLVFLGMVESTTNPGKIGRGYVCGIENDKPFCLEGFLSSKWSDEAYLDIIDTNFSNCSFYPNSSNISSVSCNGSNVNIGAGSGGVSVYSSENGSCSIDMGYMTCS